VRCSYHSDCSILPRGIEIEELRKWLERGLFLRFTTTSLTISYIAANVLSMQMNFSEESERSLLDHMQGTVSTRYGIQTVVRSYDQTMLILMKTAMRMTTKLNQPIAGSTTGPPVAHVVLHPIIQMVEMMQSSHSEFQIQCTTRISGNAHY